MDTATKIGIDATKTASKRVVQIKQLIKLLQQVNQKKKNKKKKN